MLKGTATIELTDINTGETEVLYEENIVTNIFNKALSTFPNGIQYYNNNINQLLPIIPNGIGGIILFGDINTPDPDKYYAPMTKSVVGYSDNIALKGNDPKKGEMNIKESSFTYTTYPVSGSYLQSKYPTGYQFVFDFNTDRANGVIRSISLTSKEGGKAYLGSSYYGDRNTMIKPIYSNSAHLQYLYNDNVFFDYNRTDVQQDYTPSGTLYVGDDYNSGSTQQEKNISYIIANITTIDFKNNCAYSVMCSGKNTVTVYKLFMPHNAIGLFDYTVTSTSTNAETYGFPTKILKTYTFNTATSGFATVRTDSSNYFYGTFIKGAGNTIWGLQYDNNAKTNTNGSDLIWIRIDCDNIENENCLTQGRWNFGSSIDTGYLGQYRCDGSYFINGTNYAAIKTEKYYEADAVGVEESHLYLMEYSSSNYLYGVYQIPIPEDPSAPDENWTTQFVLIEGTGSLISSWNGASSTNFTTKVNVIGNTVYYPYAYIGTTQTLTPNTETSSFDESTKLSLIFATNINSPTFPGMTHAGKPCLYCGPYLLSYSADSSYIYFQVHLAMNYLATINNLMSPDGLSIAPITKTSDKTMKITYTIQEEGSQPSDSSS